VHEQRANEPSRPPPTTSISTGARQTTDRRYLSEATMALLTTPAPQEGVATPELMTA
jgi:hypothetical protein